MAWYLLENSFILILTWISGANSCGEVPGYSIKTVKNVTVQRGLCVHIPCHFTVPTNIILNEKTTGLWFWKNEGNPPPVASNDESLVSAKTTGRFFLTGDVRKGDCSLSINNAENGDAEEYLFRLLFSDRYSFCKIKPYVTVIELTDKPVISQEKTLVANKTVTLTCTSPGRCAGFEPLITWSGVSGTTVTYQDGNKTYYSNITFTPSSKDNKSPLNCTVTFPRSNATTSQQIILNVEYPPNITIIIKGSSTTEIKPITVMEGDSIAIECIVDSNPQANISWCYNGTGLDGPVTGELLTYEMRNISSDHTGSYVCSAQNTHWTSNRSIEIIVQYAPRMPKITNATNTDCSMIYNHTFCASEGSTLSLVCSAEGSPPATLSWMKLNQNISEGLSNVSLTVSNVSFSDEGRYMCQAQNVYGSSNTNITIRMTYKPKTNPREQSCCQERSHQIECKCIIQAFPKANIMWKVGEGSYSSSYNDNDLHIATVINDSISESRLVMNVSLGHIPSIQCTGTNLQGKLDLLLFQGKQTVPSPYTTVIIAAVCALVIMAVLLTKGLLLRQFYRRRDKKTGEDKAEVSTNGEVSQSTEIFFLGEYKSEEMPEEDWAPTDEDYVQITFKQTAEDKMEFSTTYEVISHNTVVSFTGEHKSEEKLEERAPAEEEDNIQYATIIFPQKNPRAPVEVVETEYACIKSSTAAANGTSLPITE